MQQTILLFIFSSLISLNYGSICTSKLNCKDCITSSNECAWCQTVSFDNNTSYDQFKCNDIDAIKVYCQKSDIIYPQNIVNILKNEPFKPLDTRGSAVQITPQDIKLKLRPNAPQRVTISYQLAEDYPVDLYFLMDLSHSMSIHKEKLSALGQTLAQNMKNITKNFRLGFGSFVEKETMPYVNMAPRKFSNPCTGVSGTETQCVSPYSYIHHMSLTDDTFLFEREVKAAKVSGNLDAPEGGFDALMQVVVCDEIGWRSASRKLIVYSTDADFHYAGDGKLGGIVEPNDGQCHLVNRRYAYSLVQDYPSIGEINQKISQNNINLIFAVVPDQVSLYKNLSELIEGSFVGELNLDSSNIVALVVDIYKTISKKVVLATEALPEGVQVKFFSKCQSNKLNETNSCDGLKIKEKVEFEMEITLTKCPKLIKPIIVHAQGIDERVTINLESICDCNCEKDSSTVSINPYCNNHGKVVCGVCECDETSYGPRCECSKDDGYDFKGNISTCINPKQIGPNKAICNNQGRCLCGQCSCNEPSRITGKYCECDNESCDRYLSVVCAGHGKCECGICKCDAGWTKSDCSCNTDNSTCVASNGQICNGKGQCVCGKCVCDENSGYFGRKCEDCPNCPLPCENNRDCVQCKLFKSGKRKTDKECNDCDIEYDVVDSVDNDLSNKKCQFVDLTDNCTFFFSYDILNDKRIKIQRTKECPKSFPIWAIIAIIMSAVLLVGFSGLIGWKILDTMQQKRECARFNEERKKATWGTSDNPIYKPATSKFENPAYSKIKQ